MSADNTVAILRTPDGNGGFEYRVIHAQAIDNLWYTPEEWKDESYEEIGNPREIVNYFGSAEVFTDRDKAWKKAKKIYDDAYYVEYGIQEYRFEKTFDEYKRLAAELPPY